MTDILSNGRLEHEKPLELKTAARDIESYLCDIAATLALLPTNRILEVVEALHNARLDRKHVFILGNGGSSATASHFACDLGKGTAVAGWPRFKAIALTDNMPLVTAWANDTSYDDVFAEQLVNLASDGDVVIGISGSGNSPNVLNAIKLARKLGAITIGLTGFDGGELKNLVDMAIVVPNHCIQQVEDVHLILEHAICTLLRTMAQEERDRLKRESDIFTFINSKIEQVLRSLAKDLTGMLEITISYVLLLDDARENLIVWHSYPIRSLELEPGTGQRISLSEAADYVQVLESREATVLQNDHSQQAVSQTEPDMAISDGFKSVGLVPLEVAGEVWGLISLGEMRSWERSPITSEKMEVCGKLVSQAVATIQDIGAQTAVSRISG
jgi:D-sedoheptulose 7-phosphate isomerase